MADVYTQAADPALLEVFKENNQELGIELIMKEMIQVKVGKNFVKAKENEVSFKKASFCRFKAAKNA